MNPIAKTIVGSIRLALREFLTRELPSTGFPPHFASSCDKSMPGRETNHAILLLVLYNGKRVAIPTGSPKVYQQDESGTAGTLAGGSAYDLGLQVLDTMCEFAQLPNDRLSYHDMGKSFLFVLFFTGRELLFEYIKETYL